MQYLAPAVMACATAMLLSLTGQVLAASSPDGGMRAAEAAAHRDIGGGHENVITRAAPSSPAFAQNVPETVTRFHVLNAQRHLRALGYDAGPADGVPSERTRAAIAAFQRDNGLSADGQVSPVLLRSLLQAKQKGRIRRGDRPQESARPHVPAPGDVVNPRETLAQLEKRAVVLAELVATSTTCRTRDDGEFFRDDGIPHWELSNAAHQLERSGRVPPESRKKVLILFKSQYQAKRRSLDVDSAGDPECALPPREYLGVMKKHLAELGEFARAQPDRAAVAEERRRQARFKNLPREQLPPIPPKSDYSFDIAKIGHPKARAVVQAFHDDCARKSVLNSMWNCSCLSRLLTEGIFSGTISAAGSVSEQLWRAVTPRNHCIDDHRAFVSYFHQCRDVNQVRSFADVDAYCQCSAGKFVEGLKRKPIPDLSVISEIGFEATGACTAFQ